MEYAPITSRARDLMADISWPEIVDHMHGEHNNIIDGDWLDAWHEATESAFDAIDAVHAALEHENALLREQQANKTVGRVALQVRPFVRDGDKAAALKPLEEAAEVYGAWQWVTECEHSGDHVPCTRCPLTECEDIRHLADELADTITACVNLAARYELDLQAALDRVERANKDRGGYD